MTITSNDRRKEYSGNGTATDFTGPRALSAADIAVYFVDKMTGAATLQASGYTLTGVGARATKVAFTTPPPATVTVQILRTRAYAQPLDLSNQGAYYPETLEVGLDDLSMQVQQIADRVDRTISLSDNFVAPPGFSAALPSPSALKPLVWSPDGLSLQNGDTALTGDMLLRGELASAASGKGASLVRWLLGLPGAAARWIKDKLDEHPSVHDFGAVGDGVTDDTAAFQWAAAAGITVRGLPGKVYLISSRVLCYDNTRFICHGGRARIRFKTGAGGFNSKITGGDKADATVCGFLWNTKDGPGMEGFDFETDGVAERVIYPIRVLAGCTGKPADFRRIRFYGFSGMAGGLLSLNSIGDAGYNVEDIEARNCGTALTDWTGGLQITVFEVDNDMVGGVQSYPGFFKNIRAFNVLLSGAALTLYGQQTDCVNIAGVSDGTDRKGPTGYGIYADGVGEVLDCFCSHAVVKGIRARNVYLDVVKLVHGARHNHIEVESVESCGRSVVVLGSSTATNGNTTAKVQSNVVRIGTVKGIGTYGIGLTGTAAVVYIGGGQSPATAWPVNNLVSIDSVLADASVDYIVYDENSGDLSAGNEVRLRKIVGSVAQRSIGGGGTGTVAFEGNCRLRYDRRTGIYASVGTAQSLTTATEAVVRYGTETRDDLGEWDTTTWTFAPKYPGTYDIVAWVRPGGLGLGDDVDLRINKNGTKVRRAFREHYGSTAEGSFTVTGSVQVKAEDIGQASGNYTVSAIVTGAGTLSVTNVADMSYLEINGRD